LEAQQHKKYAQTTPLDDGVSSLLLLDLFGLVIVSNNAYNNYECMLA
jgi:hypothetical protein